MFTYVVIDFLNGTRKKQIEFNEEERRLSTSVMFLPGKKNKRGETRNVKSLYFALCCEREAIFKTLPFEFALFLPSVLMMFLMSI